MRWPRDLAKLYKTYTLITCISRCEQSFLYTYPSSLRILLLLRMFPFLLLSSSAASFILRFFHNNGLHFSLRHWCESDCCCDLKLRSLALCLMHKGVEYFTFSFRFIWKKKKPFLVLWQGWTCVIVLMNDTFYSFTLFIKISFFLD